MGIVSSADVPDRVSFGSLAQSDTQVASFPRDRFLDAHRHGRRRAPCTRLQTHRTRNRRMPIWHPLRAAGVVRKASARSGIDGTASLTAADLAWRARASDKATRRGRLPGLLSVVLRGPGGSRRHRRLRSPFYRGCGPCGTGQGVVLLEAAVFVFATRTAWARLVAPRSSNRPSSHGTSVHPPTRARSQQASNPTCLTPRAVTTRLSRSTRPPFRRRDGEQSGPWESHSLLGDLSHPRSSSAGVTFTDQQTTSCGHSPHESGGGWT
jgi:hypothetical protein